MEDEIRDEAEVDPDAIDVDEDLAEGEEVDPAIELEAKKKKDLIDAETESLEDEIEDELEEEDEPFDDVTNY